MSRTSREFGKSTKVILFFNSDIDREYWPLHEGDVHEPAGLDDFPMVSAALVRELQAWTELFYSNLHPMTGWEHNFDHENYLQHGQALADRLQNELGNEYDVQFIEAAKDAWHEPFRTNVGGEEWVVKYRIYDPGVYTFDWVSHPVGYGFTTGLHPRTATLSTAEMEEEIRDFLAIVDPETGFLSDDEDDDLRDPGKPPLGWPPK